MKIKGKEVLSIRKRIPINTVCEICEVGKLMNCPHWHDIHYDSHGEGISLPHYCPQNIKDDELPF